MSAVILLRVPQVNVNDESVVLVRWAVAGDSPVAEGDVVCDVETTKAVAEVTAPASGVLVQRASPGERIPVGAVLGAIGATREAAVEALAGASAPGEAAVDATAATPRARALAAEHGVSLEAVRRGGVSGTIKEADVRAFIGAAAPAGLPPALSPFVEREGPVPAFDVAVAANLRRSTSHLVLTSLDMDCRLDGAHARIQRALADGRMVSLLHVVLAAVARALPAFPRLMSVAFEGTLYRYKAVDVAFVARDPAGRLFTPVVRGADRLSVEEIAQAAQGSALKVLRGTAKAEDLEGAAFTVSHVPVPGTTRVAALPSFGQSAILGVSAERTVPVIVDGAVAARPLVTLTLSYDHALCDGVYAAGFLAKVAADLEAEQP